MTVLRLVYDSDGLASPRASASMYADIASGSSGGSARISPRMSARARSAETRDASDPSPVAIRHNSDLTSTAVGTCLGRDPGTSRGGLELVAFVGLTPPCVLTGSAPCPWRSPFRAVRLRLPDLSFPFAGAKSSEV